MKCLVLIFMASSIGVASAALNPQPAFPVASEPADSAWDNPFGTGIVGKVHAIAVAGEDVYLGGFFSTAGGHVVARERRCREIDYAFHSPKGYDDAPMSIEFKRNVYLAFKEIVTNVVKHSGAQKVEIGIAMSDGRFGLTVADDGRGFDPGGRYAGNGLASLQKRAAALGGSCEFDTRPGGGTTVKFTVKISA